MATAVSNFATLDEYLHLESSSPERHEYLSGQVFAMAGGSRNHSLIGSNIVGELYALLASKDCSVWTSDTRVRTSGTGLYTYPDVAVSCGPERFEFDTLTNPVVLIEVLSPSTEQYDRGSKFRLYRQIPSLRDYLLVSQSDNYVEHFHLDSEAGWTFHDYGSHEQAVPLSSIDATLSLERVYRKVVFDDAELNPR